MGTGLRSARLVTLGRLTLIGADGAEDRDLATRKRKLALLTVLALSKHPLTRDALVEMFWGEQPEERARHSLSDALSHLRRALGADALTQRRSEVALADGVPLTVDAQELHEAGRAQRWREVVQLYGGPFLDAVHVGGSSRLEQWIDGERSRFAQLFSAGAKAECQRLFDTRSFDECSILARRWLEEIPSSPHAALFRIRALAAESSPEADQRALDEYVRLERHLATEYGSRPDQIVATLATEIRQRIVDRQAAPIAVQRVAPSLEQPATTEPPAEETRVPPTESVSAEQDVETDRVTSSEPQAAPTIVTGTTPSRAPAGGGISRRAWMLVAAASVVAVVGLAGRLRASRHDDATPVATASGGTAAVPAAEALLRRAVGTEGVAVSRDEAVRLLDSAIRLDTTFAMAYRQLALIYSSGIDDRQRMVQMLTKAVQYADRLPEEERLLTLGSYHTNVTHDYGRAGATLRKLLEIAPNNARAWNNLGIVYGLLGDRRRAVEAFSRSATLDPKRRTSWMNLADRRYDLGDVSGAWHALDSLGLFFPGHPSLFRRTAALAHSEGDTARAEAQVRALLASARDDDSYLRASANALLAKALWSYGRVREGDQARLRGIAGDRARGARGAVLVGLLEMAQADLWLRRDAERARRRVREALTEVPLASLETLDRPYLELVTLHAFLGSVSAARAVYAEYEDSVQSYDRRGMMAAERRALGVLRVAEGRTGEGIASLVSAHDTDCNSCGLPELGWAYERAGQPDSARQVHQRYTAMKSSRKLDTTDPFHRTRLMAMPATVPAVR
jgi:DNA-binding SARP family transcriptional activator